MEVFGISQVVKGSSGSICYPHFGEGGGSLVEGEVVHEFQLGVGDELIKGENFQFFEQRAGVCKVGRFCDGSDSFFLLQKQFVQGRFGCTSVDGGTVGQVGVNEGKIKGQQGVFWQMTTAKKRFWASISFLVYVVHTYLSYTLTFGPLNYTFSLL